MKNYIKYIVLLFISFCFISCNVNDLLDEQPNNEVMVTDVEHFDALMVANTSNPAIYTMSDQDLMSDNTVWGSELNDYVLSLASIYDFRAHGAYFWEQELYSSESDPFGWARMYKSIYILNYLLERIDDAPGLPGSEATRKRVKAAAQASRAYSYFVLVNNYGKHYNSATSSSDLAVPMPLTTASTVLQPTTVQALYDQVLLDAKASIENLTDMPPNFLTQYHASFAPSKAGVLGFLSRVYLYMATDDSDQSKEYLRKSIDAAQKSMDIYAYLYDLNSEVYPSSELSHKELLWKKIGDENILGRSGVNRFPELSPRIPTDFFNLFDIAKDMRIITKAHRYSDYGDSYGQRISVKKGIYTFEVLLNKAEAHARLGQSDEALALLNTLRKTRFETDMYIDFLDTNQENLTKEILDERRREFATDETRWWDMKRLILLGEYNTTITRTYPNGTQATLLPSVDEKKYVLKIPDYILRFNPDWVKL